MPGRVIGVLHSVDWGTWCSPRCKLDRWPKPEPSEDQGRDATVDTVDREIDPNRYEASTLLVRRARADHLVGVAPLLAGSGLSTSELTHLAHAGGVVVLADVALPPATPPLAAVAIDLDWELRVGRLVAVGVAAPLRGHGLGRRLFAGLVMLLRSEGIERVDAHVPPGSQVAMFLTTVGFTTTLATVPLGLVYWL